MCHARRCGLTIALHCNFRKGSCPLEVMRDQTIRNSGSSDDRSTQDRCERCHSAESFHIGVLQVRLEVMDPVNDVSDDVEVKDKVKKLKTRQESDCDSNY